MKLTPGIIVVIETKPDNRGDKNRNRKKATGVLERKVQ
jgi:hypothetical protein